MKKIAIIGATGYTGGELLRLLTQHPQVEVSCVTSKQSVGKPLVERHPSLKGHYNLILESLNTEEISEKVDFIFVALSHTKAMAPVNELIRLRKKVVDLSADYRLLSISTYKKWYGTVHSAPSLLKKRVYGLPEVYREQIKNSTLVANPGCYPTGTLLSIYPFLKAGLVDVEREIIIDAKSGVSGAGRAASSVTHFPEVNEGFFPYSIGSHRHLPEIQQEIGKYSSSKTKINTIFTPYLLPVNRGILTSIYLSLNKKLSQKEIEAVLKTRYKNEPFIRIINEAPNISSVRASNYCDISVFKTTSPQTILLVSAIDNLVKGAAGQAIQNMNLMLGWEESLGLKSPGVFP